MGYYQRHILLFRYAGPTLLFLFICQVTGLWNAYADEVVLTNGDRISGRLISLSQKTVRISTPHSGIIETTREHIQQLETDNPVIVTLLSGERVIGRIGSATDGKAMVIHSSTLGKRTLSLKTVASIEPCLPYENITIEKNLSARLHDLHGKGSDTVESLEDNVEKSAEFATKPKPIGPEPEDKDDIRKLFLRQSSVLLNAGEAEVEIRLDYLANRLAAAIYNARFRQFQLPIGFRIGIIERVEGSVSIPFTYAYQEISFAEDSVTEETYGIGDTLLGLNFEIFRETASCPDITTVLRIRAPTGEKPKKEELSTGSGHWAGSLGFQFTKTADPVVLFWGIRYTYEYPANHFLNDGFYEVQPGDTIDYNFGFGFAVNEKISLSAQVLGGYQWETKTDGNRRSGTSGEPVSLRSALTYRVSRKTYFEPSLTMGLNDESPDFVIGFAVTRRFGN